MHKFVQMLATEGDDVEAWKRAFEEHADETALGPHAVSLIDIDDERIVLEMPMGDHARQIAGLLHGGVSMLLAETAASTHACWGIDLTEKFPVGIEINGSHLRPATDGTIRAVGTELRRGETHAVHEVEIRHHDDDRVLSECRVTNFYTSPDAG